jgi:hypothetical protein
MNRESGHAGEPSQGATLLVRRITLGVEIELAALLGVAVVGQATFAVFEIETPAWRKMRT